jgi:chitodextrinase
VTTDVNPSNDAYIRGGTYTNTNYGTSVDLLLKSNSNADQTRNAWLMFPISGYSNITSAKLRLFVKSVGTETTNTVAADLYSASASDGWLETNITYSNSPATTAKIGTVTIATSSTSTAGTWVEYDVTAYVKAETDGKASFKLVPTSNSNRTVTFTSKNDTDATKRPVLRITTGSACTPTTCAALGKNCGSVADGCGGTLSCGSCTSPQTCGGGGTANVCGGGDTTAPSAPGTVTASNITTGSVDLSWGASTDNVGVTGYRVYNGATLLASPTPASTTVSGLSAGTAYTLTVKAIDAAGNLSAGTNVSFTTTAATDTTPPSAPGTVTASSITSSSVALSWGASTDNVGVDGYQIYNGATLLASPTTTSATVTGLTAATAYTLTVKAIDVADNVSAGTNVTFTTASASSCSISVTTNTYASYDGHITYKNTGTVAESNPVVKFNVPSNAHIDTSGCAFGNQTAPGCSAVTCSQSGTLITYTFTGSLAVNASIQLYYSTDLSSEPAATGITVTSTSCP